MKKSILLILVSLIILACFEAWLRSNLFKYTSYSNSESIDAQLKSRDTSNEWNVLFIGDSETRWGINPSEIDAAFERNGVKVSSFNHAFDGFGASWWSRLLTKILTAPALENVEVVVIGIQMIDGYRVIQATGEDCGALQKPVLTSPFAIDAGIDSLCGTTTWDAKIGRSLFDGLWMARYSSTVHSLLMPDFMENTNSLQFNSRKEGISYRGFEPHRSISADPLEYNQEFERWKAQYIPERHFIPLPPQLWAELTAESGFFDQLKAIVDSTGRQVVLFALPTNPVVIDTFNRREDYYRNSRLLNDWATKRGVIFVDLGIQDVKEPEIFFSDMRHLSGEGAKNFSARLGAALAANVLFNTSISNRQKSSFDHNTSVQAELR